MVDDVASIICQALPLPHSHGGVVRPRLGLRATHVYFPPLQTLDVEAPQVVEVQPVASAS